MALDPAVTAAIIGAITTVGTAVIGVAVLMWRLQVEARRAIKELKAAEALKLKLKVYESEVVPVTESVSNAELAVSSYIRNFAMQLTNYRTMTGLGHTGTIPEARISALIDIHYKCTNQAIKIITFVET